MRKEKTHIGRIVTNSILAIIMLLPIYWTLITSLKGKQEIYEQPPSFFPKAVSLDNFKEILLRNDGVFLTYLKNSILTTIITMIFVAAISLMAGYAFSKMKIKGKKFLIGARI